MTEVAKACLSWISQGLPHKLAVVIKTWGSSPRPVGSLMAVRTDGFVVGSVSGGCVESAVIEAALSGGAPQVLHFGEVGEEAWDVGLSCGGEIEVFVFEPSGASYAGYLDAVVAGQPFVWDLLLPDGSAFQLESLRRQRLVIVGAVHISIPLIQMAKILGFECIVIEPRAALAVLDRFVVQPDLIVNSWPDQALANLNLDDSCHAVLLTHDPKIDLPALRALLRSNTAYIGALGSRRTHTQRVEQLIGEGFSKEDVERIHGPVGLSIGAKSPEEIAVSILGEIIQGRAEARHPNAD